MHDFTFGLTLKMLNHFIFQFFEQFDFWNIGLQLLKCVCDLEFFFY